MADRTLYPGRLLKKGVTPGDDVRAVGHDEDPQARVLNEELSVSGAVRTRLGDDRNGGPSCLDRPRQVVLSSAIDELHVRLSPHGFLHDVAEHPRHVPDENADSAQVLLFGPLRLLYALLRRLGHGDRGQLRRPGLRRRLHPPDRADRKQGGLVWVGALPPDELQGYYVNVSGYPGDRGTGTEQYHHKNRVLQFSERRLFYDVDTFGGQGGARLDPRDRDCAAHRDRHSRLQHGRVAHGP
jgi:hypothetical protein